MSWSGKIFWFISALSILILFIARLYIGGWISFLAIPLVTSLLAMLAAIVIDIKFYAEVLTMRTTKYGMNVGLSLVIFSILLVAINFMSVQMDQSFDVTSSNKNSLSPEIKSVVKTLDSELSISIYYRGKKDKVNLMQIKQDLQAFKFQSNQIVIDYIDIYKNAARAKIELQGVPNENKIITLLRYNDQKIQVNSPINKSEIAKAFVQVTRADNKKIHFVNVDSERTTLNQSENGLLGLKQVLNSKGFKVTEEPLLDFEKLNLSNIDMLVIAGKVGIISDAQLNKILEFVKNGGGLFVAADPSKNQNVQKLVNHFGLLFANNYIVSEVGQKIGRSTTTALGIVFSPSSDLTKSFKGYEQSFTVFEMASEVRVIKNKYHADYAYTPVLGTPEQSFTVDELKLKIKPGQRASKTLAVMAKNKNHQGQVLLFGDSDFLTNKDLLQGVNKQLAINIFSSMTGESSLVNEPAAVVKGSKIILTNRLRNTIIMAGFCMPFMLFMFAGVLFYRRKGA